MKQFLVLLAVLPITLILMVEFSLNTIVNSKIDAVNDVVYTYKELAKQEGTFYGIQDEMRNEIARVVGADASDVNLDGTYISETPIYRAKTMGLVSNAADSFIHYKIKVPIQEMKSLGKLLNENSDRYYYVIDSYTASERLSGE